MAFLEGLPGDSPSLLNTVGKENNGSVAEIYKFASEQTTKPKYSLDWWEQIRDVLHIASLRESCLNEFPKTSIKWTNVIKKSECIKAIQQLGYFKLVLLKVLVQAIKSWVRFTSSPKAWAVNNIS